jgi:hypothetical protein
VRNWSDDDFVRETVLTTADEIAQYERTYQALRSMFPEVAAGFDAKKRSEQASRTSNPASSYGSNADLQAGRTTKKA